MTPGSSRQPLCAAFLEKVDEQIDRALHLITLLPADRLTWAPDAPRAFTAGRLLGHLLECCAGFCAALYAAKPSALGHFLELRSLPTNREFTQAEATERILVYRERIRQGFGELADGDLSMNVPTVFVPAGEPLLTLLLGNLEHLVNHKQQLFLYLRLMGVPVASRDLYRFRG